MLWSQSLKYHEMETGCFPEKGLYLGTLVLSTIDEEERRKRRRK